MPKRIALDYDDRELRIVVANCNGSKVQVTDAQVIPIPENGSVSEKLRAYINSEGLQKTETLVTIGRGKAELRELQLPPVPDDELPDMVRFQAIRSFASASDRAIVDFLVTRRTNENNTLIAAAVSPGDMDRVRELCKTSDLFPKRIALRPLSAASLYLRGQKTPPICVLIDLLNDDAEIVIARDGKVIFVRTVRLPSEARHRSGAIASELHRTMVACGETATPGRIVVWGTESVHSGDIAAIKSTISCEDVQAVNPFDLVSLQIDRSALPEHIGRLAPLVGLLASDETAPETLIDFLNPRKKPEVEPDRVRRILMIAGPIAAIFLAGFFVYRQFAQWDRKIANATNEVNLLLPSAKAAEESIKRTETIDQFLDGDVNWLDEIRRLAEKAPPSDKMIVRNISGTASIRGGGGTLRIVGAVTEPSVIDELEEALRDPTHGVVGKGSQEQTGQDTYAWTFTESVIISGETIRNTRYHRMAERIAEAESQAADDPPTAAEQPVSEATQPEATQPEATQPEATQPEATQPEATQPEATQPEAAPSEVQDSEDQDAQQQPSTPEQPSNENATDTAEVQA